MPAEVDPAIIKALQLDPAQATITPHGGAGFSSSHKLTITTKDGIKQNYFVKTSHEEDAEAMFAGEYHSLLAIHTVSPTLCPIPLAHGSLSSTNGFFLLTSYINLRSTSPCTSTPSPPPAISLARKLIHLHTTPAPTPQFGFPIPTFCGSTRQTNTFHPSWSDFYAQHRLLPIAALAASRKHDPQIENLAARTAREVIPRLLAPEHLRSGEPGREGREIRAVVVHGDLWSGNWGSGILEREGETGGRPEAVVYDASACYAHSEYEFGIVRMFGGFEEAFEKEYLSGRGKD